MNLLTWAMIGIFIIMIMAVVSNSGETSVRNIEGQLFIANCPAPIFEGIVTDLNIDGFAVIYNVTHNRDINGNVTANDQDKVGTEFECTFVNDQFQVSTATRQYGATLFDFIPYGWFGYVADWLSQQLSKVGALFTLIAFVVAPANFNVLGFSLDDLNGLSVMIIVGLYVFAYIPIVLFAYKALSPFVSG